LEQVELLQSRQEYIPIEIKPDNVKKLIKDFMLTKNVDREIMKLAERKLAELV
jgi:hypothetical protein